MPCGIYSITNSVNGKVYIGKSRNIAKRWAKHKCNAKNNDESCPKLYRAMRKYGEENFIFDIIQLFPDDVQEEILSRAEIKAIEEHDSINHGYNIAPGGIGGNIGDEAREKAKKTNRARYGVDNPLSNPDIYKKANDSLQRHYGVSNPMKCPEIAEKSRLTRARNGNTVPVMNVEIG